MLFDPCCAARSITRLCFARSAHRRERRLFSHRRTDFVTAAATTAAALLSAWHVASADVTVEPVWHHLPFGRPRLFVSPLPGRPPPCIGEACGVTLLTSAVSLRAGATLLTAVVRDFPGYLTIGISSFLSCAGADAARDVGLRRPSPSTHDRPRMGCAHRRGRAPVSRIYRTTRALAHLVPIDPTPVDVRV